MATTKCIPLSDIDFYKLRSLPSGSLARNALYIIEEDSKTASFYVTDRLGSPRTVAFNGQGFASAPREPLQLYQVDVDSSTYYYYGYEYQTYWRIIRVEQSDLTNSMIATGKDINNFLLNWGNRLSLTYK